MRSALISCLAHAGISIAAPPTVTLESGTLEGISNTGNNNRIVHRYLGVPFAKPPKRFAPPEALEPSNRTLKADLKGPACIEVGGSTGASAGSLVPSSEDCLFLNVYAPAPAPDGKAEKAVMVWLFGGALQFGSASVPTYDGTSFAANQDVVMVGINYRTNVFGFPGPVPGLPKQQQNLGFLDQRMALDWVQKNIAKFGGDPDKVTIFGESAGARSVDQLLLTNGPPKKAPFRAVIMQSGSSSLNPGSQGLGNLQGQPGDNTPFTDFAKLAGCTVPAQALECLKNKPLSTIQFAQSQGRGKGISFGATYDGGSTTALDAETLRKERKVANIALLIGSNADESRTTPSGGSSLTAFLDRTFGNDVAKKDAARMVYPVGEDESYKTESDAIYAMSTDLGFSCVVAREAASSAAAGYPTWRYFFNASFPNSEIYPGSGAYHASEIPYVFGNLRTPKGPPTPEELSLSKAMQTAWANFAKNPATGPGWDKVGSLDGKDLGHFNYNGELIQDSSEFVNRNCGLYQEILDRRNKGA